MVMMVGNLKHGLQFFDTSHSDMASMSPPLHLSRLCVSALMDVG